MSGKGIVRRMDELGRIVIPKELRRSMRLEEGDEMEIFSEGEGLVVRKHSRFTAFLRAADRAVSLASSATGMRGVPRLGGLRAVRWRSAFQGAGLPPSFGGVRLDSARAQDADLAFRGRIFPCGRGEASRRDPRRRARIERRGRDGMSFCCGRKCRGKTPFL